MENSGTRAWVAAVDGELSAFSSVVAGDRGLSLGRLQDSWKRLVEDLALAPEPTRACPECGELGMREATICGYCWTNLAPLARQG
jgi:hypothetical protein